jgi:hypothetical protein
MRSIFFPVVMLVGIAVSTVHPAHATQLDDMQDELETQSFENDMRHDEEMDAIQGRHYVYQHAPKQEKNGCLWHALFRVVQCWN